MALDKKKRQVVAHFLAAFIILTHGYEKWEKTESSYWIFFLFGSLFLLLVLFHKRLAQRFRGIDSVFYVIEAILMLVTASDYYHHGKVALPSSYVVAAIGYTVAAVMMYRKQNKNIAELH